MFPANLPTISWKTIFKEKEGLNAGASRLGVNFVQASQPTREIEIEVDSTEKLIFTVAQQLGSSHDPACSMGVGAVVWDAGELLCQFLGKYSGVVRGKSVIDLGSGTGLCGLTAAVVGASITVLTDIPSLEELNEKNKSSFMRTIVDNNQLSAERRDLAVESLDKCSFASYRWGTPLPPSLELANGQFYDVIVVSDDLYDDDAFPPLLESLKILVGDNTLVLFSYKRRMDKREIPFFEKLSEILTLHVLSHTALPTKYSETHVLFGTKKQAEYNINDKKI